MIANCDFFFLALAIDSQSKQAYSIVQYRVDMRNY